MKYLWLVALMLVLTATIAIAADETGRHSVKEALNQATELYRAREYEKAVALYEAVLDSIKDDARQLYNAACTYSLAGKKQRAIDILKLTIEAGWDDYDHLARDTDLDNIREEAEYKELVADLKQKAEELERSYKFWLNPGETILVNGREFELVGIPTDTVPESARSIRDLHPFNGELFLGYGDGMANKGPVAIVSFQPAEKEWRYHFMAQEHLVARFRDIGGELFIPGAEPFEGIPGPQLPQELRLWQHLQAFPQRPVHQVPDRAGRPAYPGHCQARPGLLLYRRDRERRMAESLGSYLPEHRRLRNLEFVL